MKILEAQKEVSELISWRLISQGLHQNQYSNTLEEKNNIMQDAKESSFNDIAYSFLATYLECGGSLTQYSKRTYNEITSNKTFFWIILLSNPKPLDYYNGTFGYWRNLYCVVNLILQRNVLQHLKRNYNANWSYESVWNMCIFIRMTSFIKLGW